MRSNHPALYRQIQELPWVGDVVNEKESESIGWLAQMVRTNETSASRILEMPFLSSHEPEDASSLEALHSSDYNGKLNDILSQPVFQDGINESDIPLVNFAAYIARTGGSTEKLERILEPGYADVETQSRPTHLSPNMKVSIIRTGTERQPWIMDATFNAVELIERVYGLPLPVAHVVMIISHESTCGCTWGYAFDAPLEWDRGKDTLVGNRLQGHIVHELAHSFHVRWEYWMHDGIARVFEYLFGVENGLDPKSYKNRRGRCEDQDLQMFDEKEVVPHTSEWSLGCAYYLGGELFLELLDHLGVEEFGARLKEIYLTYRHNPPPGRYVGITEVGKVFHDQPEIVDKYWSGKFNAPENRPWDEDLFHSSHNLIQWDQHPTYDGDTITFGGTLLGDAVLSSGTIEEANKDGYGNFHIYSVGESKFTGNISPAGLNRAPRDPGDTTALEYRLEGRTFTVRFRFPQALGDPSDYFVDVWGFQDESRTPVIWDARDRLGYARIRVE